MRPENTARLTVSHRPTRLTYRDLRDREKTRGLGGGARGDTGPRAHSRRCERSHLGVSQGLAGDVALHLRLVDGVDRHPHDAAADHNGPEGVAPPRIWVETEESQATCV